MSTICSSGSRGIFAKLKVSLPHFGTIIGIGPGCSRSRQPAPMFEFGCRLGRACPPGSIWRRFGPHRPSGTTREPSGGQNRLKNGRRLVSTCQHPEAGGKASHRGRRHRDGVGPGIGSRVSLMGTASGEVGFVYVTTSRAGRIPGPKLRAAPGSASMGVESHAWRRGCRAAPCNQFEDRGFMKTRFGDDQGVVGKRGNDAKGGFAVSRPERKPSFSI